MQKLGQLEYKEVVYTPHGTPRGVVVAFGPDVLEPSLLEGHYGKQDQ